MALSTQVKMLNAIRQIFLGDGVDVFPQSSKFKPDFDPDAVMPICLPRSTPEAEGISSHTVESFYRDISRLENGNPHALLLLRNGRLISEGYYSPFHKDVWHITFSLCKSLTSAAIGLAISEGRFNLNDSVADLLGDKIVLRANKRFRAITVRHLLTMSSGITFNEIAGAVETDWIKGILSSPIAFEPGSKFVYNSMNSYLLSAIIQQTTGLSLVDYLRPRLLDPLGFGPFGWEKSPSGEDKGGWGLYMMVEDMAKLGLLYLQKGRWDVDGRLTQLIDEDWVEESTRLQIRGNNGETYGYHIWIDQKNNAFNMNGMFGQYVTVFPEQEIVIVMTAGSRELFVDSPAYTLFCNYFSRVKFPSTLPAAPVPHASLQRVLTSLQFGQLIPERSRLPKPAPPRSAQDRIQLLRRSSGLLTPPEAAAFCGKTWNFPRSRAGILPLLIQITDNLLTSGIHSLHIEDNNDSLLLRWTEDGVTHEIPAGFETPRKCRIAMDRESFLCASSAHIRKNEDLEDVLIIDIYLLEHSSFRRIKMLRRNGDLLLRLDEQPQFSVAIETAFTQDAATADNRPFSLFSLGDLILKNEIVHSHVTQVCSPEILGTSRPAE